MSHAGPARRSDPRRHARRSRGRSHHVAHSPLHPGGSSRCGPLDPLQPAATHAGARHGIPGKARPFTRENSAMKTATGTMLITNGQLIDGTGAPPVPAAALIIENGRITFAGPAAQAPAVPADAQRIDARGGTILPGLVEAHFHATYFNIAALEDLDIKYPVEYVSLLSSVNTRLALECGYTAARSGGCLF